MKIRDDQNQIVELRSRSVPPRRFAGSSWPRRAWCGTPRITVAVVNCVERASASPKSVYWPSCAARVAPCAVSSRPPSEAQGSSTHLWLYRKKLSLWALTKTRATTILSGSARVPCPSGAFSTQTTTGRRKPIRAGEPQERIGAAAEPGDPAGRDRRGPDRGLFMGNRGCLHDVQGNRRRLARLHSAVAPAGDSARSFFFRENRGGGFSASSGCTSPASMPCRRRNSLSPCGVTR